MIEVKQEWLKEPISRTCEVVENRQPLILCGNPTTAAYLAMGGGWMALCELHARKHLPDGAYRTEYLIEKGARWK